MNANLSQSRSTNSLTTVSSARLEKSLTLVSIPRTPEAPACRTMITRAAQSTQMSRTYSLHLLERKMASSNSELIRPQSFSLLSLQLSTPTQSRQALIVTIRMHFSMSSSPAFRRRAFSIRSTTSLPPPVVSAASLPTCSLSH